jgi:peptide chain release factor 1
MSMNDSMQKKLASLTARHGELTTLLSDSQIIQDQSRYITLAKEYSQLEPLVKCYQAYQQAEQANLAAQALLDDPELYELAQEETKLAQATLLDLSEQLKCLLLPADPDDTRNVFLEIRAGTGGDEAAIFAGDLFRMYSRYAELQGWQLEIVSSSNSEHGGFKEVISRITGAEVFANLKFESGVHRVQRVPETESQGRIHTSACTLAVLPEVESIDEVTISSDELRIDTFRASGAGGQHVNKTDSAIRVTHLPSGIVVECQDERSQHKNKAKALALLQAKLLAEEQRKQKQQQAATRRNLVGSGDRSERIRTYNYPQGRVTDHRINLTLYKLEDILAGHLAQVIQPLSREHQMDLLTVMGFSEDGG